MVFQLLIILLLTILVSAFSTIIGFGTGTIMVPVLLTFLPLSQTYLLVGILQLFSSIWKLWLFWPNIKWDLAIRFGLPAVIGSALGAALLFQIPKEIFIRIFGFVLMSYVVFLFVYPDFELKAKNKRQSVVMGLFLGFVGGMFGMRGPVRSAFLTAYDLDKEVYICTSRAIGIAIDVVRLAIYLLNGMGLDIWLLGSLVLLIPFSLLAAAASQIAMQHVPQGKFRHLVASMLFLVGLKFLLNL